MYSHLISSLDCQRFGFKIAKINSWDINMMETMDQLRQEDVKLIIARVNSRELKIINTLESYGFRIKDTQLTFQTPITSRHSAEEIQSSLFIRECCQQDIPAISRIAHNAFWNYGHYFADPRLDKERCAEIYPHWVENCCLSKQYAEKVWVAVIDHQVVGFVSFKVHEGNGKKYATAAISAVAENYRGRGIYQALIKKSLAWCHKNQCVWQEHHVLTTNIAIQRALIHMGFTTVNSFMTLHGWLDENKEHHTGSKLF